MHAALQCYPGIAVHCHPEKKIYLTRTPFKQSFLLPTGSLRTLSTRCKMHSLQPFNVSASTAPSKSKSHHLRGQGNNCMVRGNSDICKFSTCLKIYFHSFIMLTLNTGTSCQAVLWDYHNLWDCKEFDRHICLKEYVLVLPSLKRGSWESSCKFRLPAANLHIFISLLFKSLANMTKVETLWTFLMGVHFTENLNICHSNQFPKHLVNWFEIHAATLDEYATVVTRFISRG